MDDYDFVFIDTPPSLGLLTINALTASDRVIVPVQCEYLSMRGLLQLQDTLEMIRENLNPNVEIEGILPTLVDLRTLHAQEAIDLLEENFGKPGLRLADPPYGALRRGAGQGHVSAQIRSRRHGCPCLQAARQGGPRSCQPVNALRCARDRSPISSARPRRTPTSTRRSRRRSPRSPGTRGAGARAAGRAAGARRRAVAGRAVRADRAAIGPGAPDHAARSAAHRLQLRHPAGHARARPA